MSGNSNFPTALDDDSSLGDVTDSVSTLQAAHHNNLKEAIKVIEAKIGIRSTAVVTALDYRLGNPTGSHDHGGASGMGAPIVATALTGFSLERWTAQLFHVPSAAVGSNIAAPISIGRTGQIESISAVLQRGPSGATTAFKVLVGPTNIWGASVGLGVRFAPGATLYSQPSPNLITYPSGAIITLDAEAVGSSEPGQGLSVTFVFRD